MSFDNLPCDILLSITEKIDPVDVFNLSQVARSIKTCLDTGRFDPNEEEKANRFLNQYIEKHQLYYLPKEYRKGASYNILKLYKSVEHGFNSREEFENFVRQIPPPNLIINDKGENLSEYAIKIYNAFKLYHNVEVVIIFDYDDTKVLVTGPRNIEDKDFILWPR